VNSSSDGKFWAVVWMIGIGFVLFLIVGARDSWRSGSEADRCLVARVVGRKQEHEALRISSCERLNRYQARANAKTLTPLYVQFELTQALQAIATSGSNDTVIYLPTDPKTGLPVVPTSNAKQP
jgi:hypothetical protein